MAQFFEGNGITLEKIFNLLNIQFKEEDFEKIELDQKKLIIDFEYIFQKETSDKSGYEATQRYIASKTNTNSNVLHSIFSYYTNKNLKNNFYDDMQKFIKTEEKRKANEAVDEFFKDMSLDVFKFLQIVSCIYYEKNSYKNALPKDNLQVISILLASTHATFYKDELLIDYMDKLGMTSHKIVEYFNFGGYDKNFSKLHIKTLEEKFKKFVFEGINKDKKRNEITIESIITNSLNKELNDSFAIDSFLKSINLSIEDFDDLESKIMIAKEQEKNKIIEEKIEKLKNNEWNLKGFFELSYQMLVMLEDKKDILFDGLNTKRDYQMLALFIAFLSYKSKYRFYFENRGINLEYVLSKLNTNKDELEKYLCIDIDYKKIVENFDFMHDDLNRFSKYDCERGTRIVDASFIARRIFEDSKFDSKIVEKIIENKKVSDDIRTGITAEKEVPIKLTMEQLEKLLVAQSNTDVLIDINDLDKVIDYVLDGNDSLSNYSMYIQKLLREIIDSMNLDETLEEIDGKISNICTPVPIKQSGILSIFKSNSKRIENKINIDILDELTEQITENVDTLGIQIKKYRKIYSVITLYIKAVEKHKAAVEKALLELNEIKIKTDENDLSRLLEITQAIDGLTIQYNEYEKTIILMKQEQLKIYERIYRHFTSRSALNTAKNDIIPLIGSEVLLKIGNISEKVSNDLNKNLIGLFHSVVVQDTNDTKERLEILKKLNLSNENIDKLMIDFEKHLDEVEKYEINSNNNQLTDNQDVKVKVKKQGE